MNHGGLGYINEDRNLIIPPELLESLSITPGSILFCMYYPKPHDKEAYKNATLTHDFMLTPIPPRFWPKAGRLVVRLKHETGTLSKIADFLATNRVSILQAEATRSGHRYATWNLDVVFEEFDNKDLEYDKSRSIFPKTLDRLYEIKDLMENQCKNYLFFDENDIDLKNPIQCLPHTAMAYFYNQWQMNKTLKATDQWMYKPFSVKCHGDGTLLTEDTTFNGILHRISGIYQYESPKLTLAFAELDTRYLNIRIVLIPPKDRNRFFEIKIGYSRISGFDTCIGIISSILASLPKKYNLWRLYSDTKINEPEHEKGIVSALIEDCAIEEKHDYAYCINKARDSLKGIQYLSIEDSSTFIGEPQIHPITDKTIAYRIGLKQKKRKNFEYDVFLSYSASNIDKAIEIQKTLQNYGLSCFLAKKEMKSGDQFNARIREAILESRELCILFSHEAKQSEWVQTEWGAFWVLNRRITSILFQTKYTDLPDRLKQRQAVNIDEINKYASEVWDRKFSNPEAHFNEEINIPAS